MSDTTVFGKPVSGDIVQNNKSVVEQLDPAWLERDFDNLFEFSQVEAIRWRQYTPYFNDGDPCEFSTHDAYVKLVGADEDWGDYEDGYVDLSYGLTSYDWDYETRTKKNVRLDSDIAKLFEPTLIDPEPDVKGFIDAAQDLNKAIAGGNHEVFLRKTFGDHAEITATREGFSVDYYEHD